MGELVLEIIWLENIIFACQHFAWCMVVFTRCQVSIYIMFKLQQIQALTVGITLPQ